VTSSAVDWRWDDLADALAAGVEAASADVELEQAVHGLDARWELELHPVLREGLRRAGYGVASEVRFPRDRGLRRRSEGVRCDMVVTPGGRPLAEPQAQLGLFAPADAVALVDAAWLEVKVVAQYNERGPNRAYAAAVLVLFTADATIAGHDLDVWSSGASLRGLRLMPREQRTVPIGDRLGNRLCTVAVFPLARGPA